jgi:quercetin 2,3-dioxygenase
MLRIYPHETLGHFKNEWLDSRHHFSFGSYMNPDRVHFESLRVINDDEIKRGSGFDPHPHRDMEIITYVRRGTIIHRDNLGNEGRTQAGNIQVITAGTGIAHAEYADDKIDTSIFQIWIMPRQKGLAPSWDQIAFPAQPANDVLPLLASGRAEDYAQINEGKALYFNQDASLFAGRINKGTAITQKLRGNAYIVVSEGSVSVDGQNMKKGDGAEIIDQSSLTITAMSDAELVLIEL